jgi:hypothetical protein
MDRRLLDHVLNIKRIRMIEEGPAGDTEIRVNLAEDG